MVSATDDDSGVNSQIQYLVDPDGEWASYFSVDHDHGTVVTKKAFDYETVDRLEFNVVAVDGGIPALRSTVPVTVILTDLNDNPPRFVQAIGVNIRVGNPAFLVPFRFPAFQLKCTVFKKIFCE